jgi:type I restriction enzyme S subunit
MPRITETKKRLANVSAILKKFRNAVLKDAYLGETNFQQLGDIAELRLGKMLDQNKNKGTLQPYLRNLNVRWFGFDLNNLLEMRFEENEDERFNLIKGDLVVCEGGEPGRCAIWESNFPIKYQKALHRVRSKNGLLTKYVMYYLKYLSQIGELDQFFTGTGIKHLTGESLKAMPIPFPALTGQQKIVNRIEKLFTLADTLEEKYQSIMSRVNKVEQAVLAKAFRGELVEADPDDELAEILSKRILKEKGN